MNDHEPQPQISDRVKAVIQQLLPTRAISYLTNRIAHTRIAWIKNPLNRIFCSIYKLDLEQAETSDPTAYASFNELFTRALRPSARPLSDAPNSIVSPCDGTISAIGQLDGENIIQAKGNTYSLSELLAELHDPRLTNGMFVTIYLSPGDYHRIHAPINARLLAYQHVPGRLLTVAPAAVRAIPRLFVRNERLITIWQTELGPCALIPVGALNVGSIETVWASAAQVSNCTGTAPRFYDPPDARGWQQGEAQRDTADNNHYGPLATPPALSRGEELGRFNLGSTVILLFPAGSLTWSSHLHCGSRVLMGQPLGELTT